MNDSIRHSKHLRIDIKTSITDFFKPERIESIFPEESYSVSKRFNKNRQKLGDENLYDRIYIFQDYMGIHNITIEPYNLQITMLSHTDDEAYMFFINKIFDDDNLKDCYRYISGIVIKAGETTCARTYKELEDFRLPHLLPELSETASRKIEITDGSLLDSDYKITKELYKCQASFFNMDNAVSFSITVENELVNVLTRITALDELFRSIKNIKNQALKLLSDEKYTGSEEPDDNRTNA